MYPTHQFKDKFVLFLKIFFPILIYQFSRAWSVRRGRWRRGGCSGGLTLGEQFLRSESQITI